MKAPEKLGGVESSLGDQGGERVRTKTTSPKIRKREEPFDRSDTC